ncbi:hypothetical protein EYR36_001260 [Pleurotus pulmonarius]|nr:hypothetical protein EYR36_001260 [Pleurotus pulmonarius]
MSLTYELDYSLTDSGFTRNDTIACAAFSPTDRYIAAAVGTKVLIWDVTTAALRFIVSGRSPPLSLAWYGEYELLAGRQDGELLQVTIDGVANVFETCILEVTGSEGNNISISHIAVSPNTSRVAIGGGNHVSLWRKQPATKANMEIVWAQQTILDNPRAGGMILELPVDVTSVSFDDDWNVLVAFRHHGIHVYTIDKRGGVTPSSKPVPHNATIASASFSQDRSKFLIPNNQCGFDVYNIGTGTLYAPLRLDVNAANEDQFPAMFLHSGEYVAGGGMGMVAIWHVASQKRLVTIPLTDKNDILLKNDRVEAIVSNEAPNIGDDDHPFRLAIVTAPAALHIYRGRPLMPADKERTLWQAAKFYGLSLLAAVVVVMLGYQSGIYQLGFDFLLATFQDFVLGV